eukprot:Amastigsp_a339316_50.p4 type:complete len:104 gc:universal Amastigsp_a339316_50:248-559(+)
MTTTAAWRPPRDLAWRSCRLLLFLRVWLPGHCWTLLSSLPGRFPWKALTRPSGHVCLSSRRRRDCLRPPAPTRVRRTSFRRPLMSSRAWIAFASIRRQLFSGR